MVTTENGVTSVKDVTMPSEALPAMDNMENIQFVETEHPVSEEVVSHGDETDIAVSSLEATGSVSLSESGATITDNVQCSSKIGADTVNIQDNPQTENNVFSKRDVHGSNTLSDENIKYVL